MNLKQFFIPATVDNSPVKWGRFIAKHLVHSTTITVGMWGGLLIIGTVAYEYQQRGKKIEELQKELEALKSEN